MPVERLMSNIQKRGRDYEQSITPEYLETIQKGYFEFFKQHPDYTFLVIDTSNIDFVERDEDYVKLKQSIIDQSHKKGINRISF